MKNRLPGAWPKRLQTATQSPSKPPVHSQTSDALLGQAATHREKGRFREAEQICLKVLQSNPLNAQALYLAGVLALDADDASLAILFLKKATKGKPRDPYFNLALAGAYEKVSEFEQAIECFKIVLASKPDLVGALCGLGIAYGKA